MLPSYDQLLRLSNDRVIADDRGKLGGRRGDIGSRPIMRPQLTEECRAQYGRRARSPARFIEICHRW
jgi:hypothetical protein